MHPLLKSPRALAAYGLSWALAAAVLAAAWAGPRPADWGWPLVFAVPVACLTGLAALVLHGVCRSMPLRPARWPSGLLRRGLAAALLALAVVALAWLWNGTGALWGRPTLLELSPVAWPALLGALAMVFMVAALVHDALLAQQAVAEAAATESLARLHAREMEIKALRNQLDPHFLFNSLNAISALIPLDGAAARQMTIELAQFFRQTLSLGERERIRLDEELALVQHYLAIEQRRLGDRLRLSLDVPQGCGQAVLPPLLLQPLVENAIKHGIRHLDEGGLLEVRARREAGQLQLWVRNPVDPQAEGDASGLGQGLRQLRARLQAVCGATSAVHVRRDAGHFSVEISVPWAT